MDSYVILESNIEMEDQDCPMKFECKMMQGPIYDFVKYFLF